MPKMKAEPIAPFEPGLTAVFPPTDCSCTWIYSPNGYGSPDKPFALKFRHGLCRSLACKGYTR